MACLPDVRGLFLRCDRGNSLYVTNAPARTDEQIDWAKAGFSAQDEGKLTFLIPGEEWIAKLEAWLRERVEATYLAGAVRNACFGECLPEDMGLWIEGVKRLEMKGDAAGYEKLVRQRAAVCLRKKTGGGTLVVCALLADLMNEGGIRDEA